jgi:hypothetical protein
MKSRWRDKLTWLLWVVAGPSMASENGLPAPIQIYAIMLDHWIAAEPKYRFRFSRGWFEVE